MQMFFTVTFLLLVKIIVGGEEPDAEFDWTSIETDPALDPGRILNITPPETPKEFPPFITGSVKALHGDLFKQVFNILLKKGLFYNSVEARSKKPYEFKNPVQLGNLINFDLEEAGVNHTILLKMIEQIIQFSPHVSHPFHLTKDSCGLNPYAAIGDIVASTITNVLLTYYAAPVYTLLEIAMTTRIRQLIGWTIGTNGTEGDGVTTPGGNFANILALQLAMRRKFPETRSIGLTNTTFAIFVSEDAADCSFLKAAALEGLSSDGVVKIRTDAEGRLDINDLIEQIKKVNESGVMVPLMVIATVGTPVLGSIDGIEQLANISRLNDLWFHVDATRGAPLLLSAKHRLRLAGVENADSLTWSSSHLLGTPQASSFLVTKESDLLDKTFSYGAKYVFAKTQLYNKSYDQGDKTIQTARRPDVLKTWLLWKAMGEKEMESNIDHIYKLKSRFLELVKNSSWNEIGKFQLITQDFDTPIISFFYIPSWLVDDKNSPEYKVKLTKFTNELKNQLLLGGVLHLSTSSYKNFPKFLTISLANSVLNVDDLPYILDQIVYYGEHKLNPKNNGNPATEPPLSIALPKPKLIMPNYVSAPIYELHRSFFVYVFQMLISKGLFFQTKRRDPPRRFRSPEVLSGILDMNINSTIPALTHGDLFIEIEKVITYSSHQSHPFWVYQLFTGLNPYSLVGEYIVAALKPSMMSYKDNPVFTLAENAVLHKIRQMLGYPNNGEGDGLINPGGSLSNILAIALARYHKFPEIREKGMIRTLQSDQGRKKLVFYVSVDAHYSFNKGAFTLGIGLENCVMIKADDRGRMSMPHLIEAINKTLSEGNIPFMVAGTAGTTVLGSIDPLEEIGKIAKEYNMWFHVDAIFGGGLLWSTKYSEKLKGVEMSDSFAINAHKMFAAAMTISSLVTRYPGITRKVFGTIKDFSTVGSGLYDNEKYDLGDKHILGYRTANAFKFWMIWKAQGTSGLNNHIDYVMENTEYAVQLLKEKQDIFELILPEYELTNVCFLYIPKQYRLLNRTSDVFKLGLAPVADKLQVILVENGILDIVVQTTASMDTPTFMKLVLMSSTTTKEDIRYLLEQIDFYGQNL